MSTDLGLTVKELQSLTSALLHSTILLVLCHGIHTCVFSIALYYIAESAYSKRKRITFASIVTFFWCTNTIIVAIDWKAVDELFITYGPSLVADYYSSGSGVGAPQRIMTAVLRILNVFLADLILIWRCWVLYGGDWKIVAAPGFCLLTELISACFLTVYTINPNADAPHQPIWTMVYYAMTVTTNSLCTFFLLFRSLRYSHSYRGIVDVFVESAAMYAIIYIALLVVYTYEFYSPDVPVMVAYSYPQVMSISVTGIATTLIIARVMARQARTDNASPRNMLITMYTVAESLRYASASSRGRCPAVTDSEQRREALNDARAEGSVDGFAKSTHCEANP